MLTLQRLKETLDRIGKKVSTHVIGDGGENVKKSFKISVPLPGKYVDSDNQQEVKKSVRIRHNIGNKEIK